MPQNIPGVTFAVFSDLHVEGSSCALETSGADAVLLVGDIFAAGRATENAHATTIDWIARQINDKPVVFVPGNHDFETARVEDQMMAWKKRAQEYGNIDVLWNEAWDWGGVRVLGTPLFTDFQATGNSLGAKAYARQNIIDFSAIFTNTTNKAVTVEDYVRWNREAVFWLDQELDKDPHIPKIVATHFSPSLKSCRPELRGRLENAYWMSDRDDLVARADVWVSGHTHHCVDTTVDAEEGFGRLVSNARGTSRLYNLSSDPNFENPKLVHVPPRPAPTRSPSRVISPR